MGKLYGGTLDKECPEAKKFMDNWIPKWKTELGGSPNDDEIDELEEFEKEHSKTCKLCKLSAAEEK